ncbi:MAG: hypothetical protein K2X39_05740 [Silvanigrellaceae bacterium]|nr:hypothetical protein [Silvanigrellaceae bacterium]
MYKTAIFLTLLVGMVFGINNADATTRHVSVFKSMNTIQNSPWDPRSGERADQSETTDGQAKEDLPLEQQAEE